MLSGLHLPVPGLVPDLSVLLGKKDVAGNPTNALESKVVMLGHNWNSVVKVGR